MKTKLIATIAIACLTSCTYNTAKFTGIKPVSPQAQDAGKIPRVGRTNPSFSWNDPGATSDQYDFSLWKLIPSDKMSKTLDAYKRTYGGDGDGLDSLSKGLGSMNNVMGIEKSESPQSFSDMYLKSIHKLVFQKDKFDGCSITVPVNLEPNAFYLWSVRRTGSTDWSSVNISRTNFMAYMPNSYGPETISTKTSNVPFLIWTSH